MTITNELIGNRIKAVRQEQGFTQKDIAAQLGRTVGAISQLEQGMVNVSAIDLYKISTLLNKPIEYFVSDEERQIEIANIASLAQRETDEGRKHSVELTTRLLNLFQLADTLDLDSEEKPTEEQLKTFLKDFVPAVAMINSMSKQLNDLWEMMSGDLEVEGIDVEALLKSLNVENPTEF